MQDGTAPQESPNPGGEKPNGTDNAAGAPMENGGENGKPDAADAQNRRGGMPDAPGGFGGERGRQQFDWKENLPTIAICGGAFLAGVVVLVCFRRKKELKPPKEESSKRINK